MSKFSTGDRVEDTEQEEPATARVLREFAADASTVMFDDGTGRGMSVAEANPEYPEDADVVEIAFEDGLDHNVPEWREWPADELRERLNEYTHEWGVAVRTYHYPVPRLREAEEPTDDDEVNA